MARPFLSLLIAATASTVGLALTWSGGAARVQAFATFSESAALLPALQTLAGALLLGVAAASIAVHWVGALVVGAVHALLGLLALVAPFGNSFAGGIFSPVFQITRMLSRFDRALGDGATVFYFSGTALVVGAFLAAAALGIRSRRLAGPSSRSAVAISSTIAGVLLLVVSGLLVVAGSQFVRSIVQLMRYDDVSAVVTVIAGVLAGLAGLLLRWSSLGSALVGAIVLVVGLVLFISVPPPGVPGWFLGAYGLVLVLGATFVGAALGGLVRGASEVPESVDDL